MMGMEIDRLLTLHSTPLHCSRTYIPITMAERQKPQTPAFTRQPPTKLILVSGGVVLLLTTGLTVVTAAVILVLSPLILISTPILVPIAAFVFVSTLSLCGFTLAMAAALSWLYKYCNGLHPPGSDRLDYARSRIQHTATHIKDYAREYGGCFHTKLNHAAPGA